MGKPTGFLKYQRTARPERPALERIRNFDDFHLPLDEAECRRQAARCMDCGIPFCQSAVSYSGVYSGCPLHNLIPEYNDAVYRGHWKSALERLLKTNNFPEFTGRVCPALCENACVCGINDDPVTNHDNEYAIIERGFREGWMAANPPKVRSQRTVAVIGSGPAGLAAADCLNKRGHSVTVFEREDRCGGLLMYGIPNMKLDKSVIERRLALMQAEGVEFSVNCDIGHNVTAEELRREYDAVILCCGAKQPRELDVPGNDASGIFQAVDFLTQATRNLLGDIAGTDMNSKGQNVIVVGGGDTGNDCVATALRQGCASCLQLDRNPKAPERAEHGASWPLKPDIYRPDYGQAEAIAVFGSDPRLFSSTVKKIIKDEDGHIREAVVVKINKSADKNGKRIITEIPQTEQTVRCDMMILAAGFSGCEEYTVGAFGIERSARGTVKTKEGHYATETKGVFAAGDSRRGQSLVVWAIAEGRACAKEVDEYLMEYSNM